MLYILLTLSLWWRNPSRCGLTTKPLPSHLQGESRCNCTKLHIPQSGKERAVQKERYRKTIQLNNTDIWLHDTKHRVSHIQVSSSLSVCNITHLTPIVANPIFVSTDLLPLMLSEWSIGLSSSSERQHLQAHPSWAATACLYPPAMWGHIHCAQQTPLLHIICPAYLSVTEIPAVNHSTANQTQHWSASSLSLWITPTVKEVTTTVFPRATHADVTWLIIISVLRTTTCRLCCWLS